MGVRYGTDRREREVIGEESKMSLTSIPSTRSSWIRAIGYVSDRATSDGHSYLAIFSDSFAWLVQDVPPTLPGLLTAGRVTAKDDGALSIGATVRRLVLQKSEYPRQMVKGKEMWRLRAMMKAL
jgi:hypothetical protein